MLRLIRILFVTRYSNAGASSRLRIHQYEQYFRNAGFLIESISLFPDIYLRDRYAGEVWGVFRLLRRLVSHAVAVSRASRYDVVWVEKEVAPFMPYFIEKALLRSGVPIVADYDDAIFHNYDRHGSWLVRAVLGRKIDAVMSRASVVMAGNAYIAERARAAGARRIELVPTVIDIERYPVIEGGAADTFTIGWIGTPVTAKYLPPLAGVLAEVCSKGRGRVLLIGAGDVALPGVPVEVVPWDEATEVDQLRRIDVGIMPLVDGDWERGKCGYKLIQYMACGKPVIASPVGVNRTLVEERVNGFCATTQDEWRDRLVFLRDNPSARRAMGACGRALVEQKYCLQVTAPRVAEILRSVVAPGAVDHAS